jgi:hypothetical protein
MFFAASCGDWLFAGFHRPQCQGKRNKDRCDNAQDNKYIDVGQEARLLLHGLPDPGDSGLRRTAAR